MWLGTLFAVIPLLLQADPMQVGAGDIQKGRTIIAGHLGLPLGTPVEVEAQVVLVTIPDQKNTRTYHMVVTKIDGASLSQPKIFRFRAESELRSLMPRTEHELKKLLNSYVEGDSGPEMQITKVQAEAYLLEHTVRHRKFTVYETAEYTGRPRSLPAPKPIYYAPDFAFETCLVIVAPETPAIDSIIKSGK